MWSASDEPPGPMEGEPPEPLANEKEKCVQKNQLESYKEIMLRNRQTLKEKEEEAQEYARRLSKIKSRAKLSRRSKDGTASSKDAQVTSSESVTPTLDKTIEDISQATTPKAKSTLLQQKLVENRKAFEQRSKEITESKRAVEEKVEAIRQQLEDQDSAIGGAQKELLAAVPVQSEIVVSDILLPLQLESTQENENNFVELSNKILELEAMVLDLQENLKEKDSVIDSKTKAITLMSADLSRKGKTTLDTLEDTKGEMRTMQEHFVLLETSLKEKNQSLLEQLKEREEKISELEDNVKVFQDQIGKQQESSSAAADFSRSTMDALMETKDAMKSMQENFVLVESSLKTKNENLLQQLEDYVLKLAEANERIFQLESGLGIRKSPAVDDLQFKIEKLEKSNKQLQDEKYELQKSIAEIQDKIINQSLHGNGAIVEKDNRIAELENLVEELKQSNKLLEEESKSELEKQLADLTIKNEDQMNKIMSLEKEVHDLEVAKDLATEKLQSGNTAEKEDEKVMKLTKEVEDLNKTITKIKAQHKGKVKNLQRQLENFRRVSDTNAELVRLGNQVALLEEEKGNLQLSLVDFDELKASARDWQERIEELETKVSAQAGQIQGHIEAIATLESQKLDLMQELHTTKQEFAALEAENEESENSRVVAEMKIVDLEEQLESAQKQQKENDLLLGDSEREELMRKIDDLTRENGDLYSKLAKLEEKSTSDSGSTESFETVQESDKSDSLRKIEELTQRNNELNEKLSDLEKRMHSQVDSTESFETITEVDKNELLKKIDHLIQENTDLNMKLSRIEEKGSSDTASTESFERIPGHGESISKIELLTQENQDLSARLLKLEEQLARAEKSSDNETKSTDLERKLQMELSESSIQSEDLNKLREEISKLTEENEKLQAQIEDLVSQNNQLISENQGQERIVRETGADEQIESLMQEKSVLEKEIKELRNALAQSEEISPQKHDIDALEARIDELLKENSHVYSKMTDLEELNKNLKDNLNDVIREKEELLAMRERVSVDDFAKERHELIDKLEKLNQEKESVAQERQELQEQISKLHKSNEESWDIRETNIFEEPVDEELLNSLKDELETSKHTIAEQEELIREMTMKLNEKDKELDETLNTISEYEVRIIKAETHEQEWKSLSKAIEEWKQKCKNLEEKLSGLESEKESINDEFRKLQREYDRVVEELKEKDMMSDQLRREYQMTVTALEAKLETENSMVLDKDAELNTLRGTLQSKDHELKENYKQLQNNLLVIDNLQNELGRHKMLVKERNNALMALNLEIQQMNQVLENKEEETYKLKQDALHLHQRLQNTKPMEEYKAVREALEYREALYNELHKTLIETKAENKELATKLQNLLNEKHSLVNEVTEKRHQISEMASLKDEVIARLRDAEIKKSNAEQRIWQLEGNMENDGRYVANLQKELKDAYRQMEQLRLKHTEDTEMQNQRLEVIIEDLDAKTRENEVLKMELEEKARLVGQNVTEENKIALESELAEVKEKLSAAEDKIQAQLEKMKKIAANLKKKSAMCQELEGRMAELEEKWTTEKDEKEAKNKQIQEFENSIREKDNRIQELQDEFMRAKTEATEATENLDKLTNELSGVKEKILVLTEQIAEMEEEITKLRTELEQRTAELAAEKETKKIVQENLESYQLEISQENQHKELEMEDVRERARELSVRMQVMEDEYVEQLALINHLKTENGFLVSKQAHINEKLEIAEKKSEEQALLIEEMRNNPITAEICTQTSQETEKVEEIQEQCTNCEQCQTVVQALEAKLQEREAEIKNLDNELANSVSNFVQMRESLRAYELMNQTENLNRDALQDYNTLTENIDEIKMQLDDASKENKELKDKIENLELTNMALKEKVENLEQELTTEKVKFENIEVGHPTSADLTIQCEEHEKELLSLREELEAAKMQVNQLTEQLSSEIFTVKSEKETLEDKEETLMRSKRDLEQEIELMKADKDMNLKKIADLENELKRQTQENSFRGSIPDDGFEEGQTDRQVDNAPQLFDASKMFGVSFTSENSEEIERLQSMLREKDAHCSNLTEEINHLKEQMQEERSQLTQDCNRCSDELNATQERLSAAKSDLERLENLVAEKSSQIDSLNTELSNVDVQMIPQCSQQDDSDSKLEELMSLKDNQINELKAELNSTTEILEVLTTERDQQVRTLESNRVQIASLEAELRNSTDTDLVEELQKKITDTIQERDLLQLQLNDLTRTVEELETNVESQRNLKDEVETARKESDEAKEMAANLMRALEEARKTTPDSTAKSLAEEPRNVAINVPSIEQLKPVEKPAPQVISSEEASAPDSSLAERFNIDAETWEWYAEDMQGTDEQLTTTLAPSEEAQLRAQVGDLQDRIKDLEAEKAKILEENKTSQLRSAKLVKKLKEYKVQIDNLQQQLKIQKSTSDFYELDSAIEEELKAQISKLEKSLKEVRDECKNIVAEKESLSKRLDVVVSANERYMEMKEKQDMEMEVLRIQNKDLTAKVQGLDTQQQEDTSSVSEIRQVTETHGQPHKRSTESEEELKALCKKYEAEIDDLKDQMDALASENEQLQRILEEQKVRLDTSEKRLTEEHNVAAETIDELNRRSTGLQGMLEESKEELDILRKQYDRYSMESSEQISSLQTNIDRLNIENHEKISRLEEEKESLQQQVEAAEFKANQFNRNLEEVQQEKAHLQERVSHLSDVEEKLSETNSTLSEMSELLNTRIQEVADLKQELQRQYIAREENEAESQNTIRSLMENLNEKKQELENLQQSFNEKEKGLLRQQSVEAVNAIVSQATQELAQKHAIEIEERDKEIRSLSEKLSMLQMAIDEYSLEMQGTTAKLESQQHENNVLRDNLTEKDSLLSSSQSELYLVKEAVAQKEIELSQALNQLDVLRSENQRLLEAVAHLQEELSSSEKISHSIQEYTARIQNLQQETERLMYALEEKDVIIKRQDSDVKQAKERNQMYEEELGQMQAQLQLMSTLQEDVQNKTQEISYLSSELEAMRLKFEDLTTELKNKTDLLEKTKSVLSEKELELEAALNKTQTENENESLGGMDEIPLFRMSDNNTEELQRTIDALRGELETKQQEIENFRYILNESTYPSMLQELQERINTLYNEKAELETEIEELRGNQTPNYDLASQEDTSQHSRERRSVKDQEELVTLQNELHTKEQEINELKYIIAEKDSQLSLQASMEPQSDDFELRNMVERLTTELYSKEQEVQHLKATIESLHKETLRLKEFEALSAKYKDAIDQITAEKESVRIEARQYLEQMLKGKELIIDDIKQKISLERQKLLEALEIRENDLTNLKLQLGESISFKDKLNETLHEKETELQTVNSELAEKERRLAELSITKDAEIHNLKMQIHEKDARIEELLMLSEEEERQMAELKNTLDSRETEINALKKLLEDKVTEYELIQQALKKDVPIIDRSITELSSGSTSADTRESASQELDLALYMLHQRDVRCEELTHELMQLLEERDTLQLRLSNAIRINEELRKTGNSESSVNNENASNAQSEEPLIEHPSPSKSEGPVEIAKEAIDAPVGENKEALALKLSQLHTVSHAKDVRLKDDRELRHTQQMSLLAHRDVLSTLPPEAAARLVNANYTLSRDVQSQSSVLLNWLWGKSTPKVVHM